MGCSAWSPVQTACLSSHRGKYSPSAVGGRYTLVSAVQDKVNLMVRGMGMSHAEINLAPGRVQPKPVLCEATCQGMPLIMHT